MKLADIEVHQYKGTVSLEDGGEVRTADVFYDEKNSKTYEVIRALGKWRLVVPNEKAKKTYEVKDWSDLESR